MNCCMPKRINKRLNVSEIPNTTRRPNQISWIENPKILNISTTFDQRSYPNKSSVNFVPQENLSANKNIQKINFSKVLNDENNKEQVVVKVSTLRQPGDLNIEGKFLKLDISVFGSPLPALQKDQSQFQSQSGAQSQLEGQNISTSYCNPTECNKSNDKIQNEAFQIKGCIYHCDAKQLLQHR